MKWTLTTSLDSNTIYAFREDRAKKGVTRTMRLQVSLVLIALRRLERLGLISRKEADSTSKVGRYHENNPTPEGKKMTEFILKNHLKEQKQIGLN